MLRLMTASAAALLLLSALLAPWLSPRSPVAAATFYAGFDLFCHQDPARTFWIAGLPAAACARCLGVLGGGVIALFLPLRLSKRISLLLLSLAGAAWAAEAGLSAWPPEARFLAGTPLGLALLAPLTEAFRR